MAGTIASRNGSATVTPAPRRKVRRDNDIFVMNMARSSSLMLDGLPGSDLLGRLALGSCAGLIRIWNGALLTMPSTMVENL